MNKILITKWHHSIVTARLKDGTVTQFQIESDDHEPTAQRAEGGGLSILNNIYIGKVKNIVKNINCAFVEIGNGQMAYYNLTENQKHHFTSLHMDDSLKTGDEIIVQIAKDAVKTKDPVVSSNLSFAGQYCVLTTGKTMIGFSGKINDQNWITQTKEQLIQYKEKDFGIIIRTNAQYVAFDQLVKELKFLVQQYRTLMKEAQFRTCYSLLYQDPPLYLSNVRDAYQNDMDEILTDDIDIFQSLHRYLEHYQIDLKEKLHYYGNEMVSLTKLYNLEKELNRALDKKVWLKSGGYLVIEPTEALVVIDVNTGKYAGKKNPSETILKINLEAAEMIARQLRLRNLSGIIIVDFIDMGSDEQKQKLLSALRGAVANDPIKTTVVGMTSLNLVELTRKKVRKPLYEQIGNDYFCSDRKE